MPDAYDQVLDVLRHSCRVLVTTHVRPDGDALGSTAAMVLGLRQAGVAAHVLLLSHLPSKYAFIFTDNSVPYTDVESGWPADFSLRDFDTLLVVDTGTWSQLPGLRERLDGFPGRKLVVDHHLTQEDWADVKLVVTDAAAAAQIVADLLKRWPVPLNPGIAGALFLGLSSDTGWFAFSNTRPGTLRLAADLMEAGVDTDRLYQSLYQNERPERLALQTRAQQSMQLLADSRLSVMRLEKSDFQATRAGIPDTENLINIPLQLRSVEVSLIFVEPPAGGPVRVSLRSKGKVDVARFAEKFGGGGHARAAGLKVEGSFADVCQRVTAAMVEALAH